MIKKSILGIACLLAGCASPQQLAKMDNDQCKSYGLQFGTPAYGECRIRLAEMRQRQMAAAAASNDALAQQAMRDVNSSTTCMRTGNMVTCN
jgi:hypothetical protein